MFLTSDEISRKSKNVDTYNGIDFITVYYKINGNKIFFLKKNRIKY